MKYFSGCFIFKVMVNLLLTKPDLTVVCVFLTEGTEKLQVVRNQKSPSSGLTVLKQCLAVSKAASSSAFRNLCRDHPEPTETFHHSKAPKTTNCTV